jgi:hypothetical protein
MRRVCYGEKFEFEFVPLPCLKVNLHCCLPRECWDRIRKNIYHLYSYRCVVCGTETASPECHEVWRYDIKRHMQLLDHCVCICKRCHQYKHLNQGTNISALEDDGTAVRKAIVSAYQIWQERNKHIWNTCVPHSYEPFFHGDLNKGIRTMLKYEREAWFEYTLVQVTDTNGLPLCECTH